MSTKVKLPAKAVLKTKLRDLIKANAFAPEKKAQPDEKGKNNG